ncbi:MAG: iron-containing alcohol dehydrogenase [Smithellaceae bacterium]|nr:iron-containing alcohol dehydrogenase [Smithellaceae bacterium]
MNPETVFTFTCPVKTNSGNKALENLPIELSGLNAGKPLIVTSIGKVGRNAIRTLTGAFGDSGMTLGVFDGLPDKVDPALIEQLRTTIIEGKYDSVISLGGGTIVDSAKILNLAVSLKTTDVRSLSAQTPVNRNLLPLVVVLTANATGLETSQQATLNGTVLSSEYLAPVLVVIDPRLTRGKEGKIIYATGLAALGRALEAHIGAGKNPFREAYSFAAIRFIRENLPAAVRNPDDKKTTLAVLNAAAMSGCAFSGTDASPLHKLGQVFQEVYNIHPGIIMGMCLPHILGDYLHQGGHDLSSLLQPLTGDDDFTQTPEDQRAGATVSVLNRFMADLYSVLGKDVPQTLKEPGVPRYVMEDILDVLDADPDGVYLRAVVGRIWDKTPVAEKKG